MPCAQRCLRCGVRPLGVCAVLDTGELADLDQLAQHVRYASRETLFLQDEAVTSVYNLSEGALRLYKLLSDGRRQIVGFALPGDFLGAGATDRYGFSADAIGAVELCRFPVRSFAQFIKARPHFLLRLNEFANRDLASAQDQMLLLGRRTAEEKVAAFLVSWRVRLRRLGGDVDVVHLPMGRQDIADFLGLTIETVSRTFTRLERDGIIAIVPHGVRPIDSERMEALAAA